MKQVAIIGSGPAGCFLAEILALKLPDVQIDLYERLPHPFGLAVSGVAPDHLHTRKVTEQLQRTLDRDQVKLICNTELGRDIHYDELKARYHRVILATGASEDRQLGISGEQLTGIYGSGAFTRWYNQHPEAVTLHPHLGERVGIIGNGNVALDIARMLAKTPAEHQQSDLSDAVRNHLAQSAVREIHILGRRGPADASFTLPELTELGALAQANVQVSREALENIDRQALPPSQQKVLNQLQQYAETPVNQQASIQIHFHFYSTPVAAQGHTQLEALTICDSRSQHSWTLPLDTLVTAIGYRTPAIDGVPYDESAGRFAHQNGKIEPGVYCTGWCQRGPQGVIPTNRSEAMQLARHLIREWEQNDAD
ncbi:MAG: FAD-dependent oxidoreductase [Nitrincola lacisaponensis]|uniref:FAD-dependent oxidoreductase n=1 Tax=Nitrincola lacisaponensis TaxID=267850 RepID=UPI00391D476E